MDFWTDAIDIATMATGLSRVTAASVWNTGRVDAFRQNRAVKLNRVWNIGYIMMGIILSWDVRLADDDSPGRRTGRVIVEVLREAGGETDPQMVATFRKAIKSEGWRTIPPTPAQAYFLKELERARRRAGLPIRLREELVVTLSMGTYVAER